MLVLLKAHSQIGDELFLFSRYLIFCLDFLVKNNLIRKIRLISKFMTSQPGSEAMAMHILPNISQSNQTMKLGKVIEYNKRNIFLRKSRGKWGRETSSIPLFVFQKALYEVKASSQPLSIVLNLANNKNKMY